MKDLSTRPAGPVGRLRTALFLLFWMALAGSGIQPSHRIVWFFQCVTPAVAALILYTVRKRFLPAAATSCALFVQGLLLLVGAHFLYHRIPIFRLTLPDGTERGYVDWIVHFIDGIVFVLLVRDILAVSAILRANWLFRGMAVLISLGLAALWELTEWAAGLISGNLFVMMDGLNADSYVDMAMTLAGSLLTVPWLRTNSPTCGER